MIGFVFRHPKPKGAKATNQDAEQKKAACAAAFDKVGLGVEWDY